MSEEPPATPRDTPTGGGWLRPVALILSCLVLGFVGGWILRGDDGTVTILDAGAPLTTGESSETAPQETAPTPPTPTTEEVPPPERSAIALVVLNATDTGGLAGSTAAEAESVGYSGVIAGNAPTSQEPSTVYHVGDNRPAAERVARDLRIGNVAALPPSGPIAEATREANPDAMVAVVLGP